MYNSLYHGLNSTISETPVQVATDRQNAETGILLLADDENTVPVYIGSSSGVNCGQNSDSGFPLSSGDSIFLSVAKVANIYAVASGTNQKLWWILV